MAIDLRDELLAFTGPRLGASEPLARVEARPQPGPRRDTPGRVARPSRSDRRRPTALTALLVLALLWLPMVAPSLKVDVDGRRIVFNMWSPTVATVLQRVGTVPTDGALLGAVTRRLLDAHYDRAEITRRGKAVTRATVVHSGDAIAVRHGRSEVEATVRRSVAVAGGALPAIEYQLWHAPRDGVTDQLAGVRSGEVVQEAEVSAPVAARPMSEPAVGLTFDDGPHPDATPAVLAILRAAGVKATFCIVGYAARQYPELVKAIHADGHALCNHTMHHVQLLGRRSPDVIAAELRDGNNAIADATGVRAVFFRAPGGTWASNLIDEVHRQGMRALGWNVDPADYERPGAAAITQQVLSHLHAGAVILLHDGGGDRSQTVAQLARLIDGVRARGYSFSVPA